MISILIPVYNTDVRKLVFDLSKQSALLKSPCEIIVLDDGSIEDVKQTNRKITSEALVHYRELKRNCGRVEVRKKLAQLATQEWLLFIDSDSRIVDHQFLERYQYYIAGSDVVVGGTLYEDKKPLCPQRLHWKYGKTREIAGSQKKSFRTNNLLIKKSIFHQLRFPDDLKGYGHEDTLIGIQLEDLQAKVNYINNPVLHLGLEQADQFILKTESALNNLLQLRKTVKEKTLRGHVTLYDIYCRTRRWHRLIEMIYRLMKPLILQNLKSCRPVLICFDFYRLNRLIVLARATEY